MTIVDLPNTGSRRNPQGRLRGSPNQNRPHLRASGEGILMQKSAPRGRASSSPLSFRERVGVRAAEHFHASL